MSCMCVLGHAVAAVSAAGSTQSRVYACVLLCVGGGSGL